MAIIAQSRPEINMEDTIGTFSCVAWSGQHQIPVLSDAEASSEHGGNETGAVVNAVVILQGIEANPVNFGTCKEFVTQFAKCIELKTANYNTVHVIFDHHNSDGSLKKQEIWGVVENVT